MTTVRQSSAPPAERELAGLTGSGRRNWLAAAAAVVGISVCIWLLVSEAVLGYDPRFALLWGQQLAGGALPDYEAPFAPTAHPLAVVIGALASLAGDGAAVGVLTALAYLCFGGLVWSVFRLGKLTFSWPVGVLGALLVATSVPMFARAMSGYLDIPFVALVLIAAALEVARPRRGPSVLILLTIAGLLRPEAWVLAGVYWLYLAPTLDWRRRILTAALAAAAPVLWGLVDLVVTGNALFSLTSARQLTVTGGPVEAPTRVASTTLLEVGLESFRTILRLHVIVFAAGGLVLAAWLARSRAAIPAALLGLGLAMFGGLIVLDLPVSERYLFVPSAAAALFCAFLALGWLHHPRGRVRRAWAAAGSLALIGLLASMPAQISRLDRVATVVGAQRSASDDLRALAGSPVTGPLLRSCSPIWLPTNQPLPTLAYHLKLSPAAIRVRGPVPPPNGLFVAPANARVGEAALSRAHNPARSVVIPPGFRRVSGNASWIIYARGC